VVEAVLPLEVSGGGAAAATLTIEAAPPSRRDPVPLPPLLSDGLILNVVGMLRALPVSVLTLAVALTVILAQSRSGLITFLAVTGLYFIRRVGVWGVIVGCVFAPPMLLLGGRKSDEAQNSSDERAELLREGFEFIRNTKGFGLGVGQFPSESSIGLTAHNSYVLAAAEAGIVGLFLFTFALYLSIKVPL
jgi:O-antigen ligase